MRDLHEIIGFLQKGENDGDELDEEKPIVKLVHVGAWMAKEVTYLIENQIRADIFERFV